MARTRRPYQARVVHPGAQVTLYCTNPLQCTNSLYCTNPRRPYDGGVDVRIGVTYTAKELDIDMAADTDPDVLRSQVEVALGDGAGVLWLTDRKGRQFGIPVAKLAYIEIGSSKDERRIGFGGT